MHQLELYANVFICVSTVYTYIFISCIYIVQRDLLCLYVCSDKLDGCYGTVESIEANSIRKGEMVFRCFSVPKKNRSFNIKLHIHFISEKMFTSKMCTLLLLIS